MNHRHVLRVANLVLVLLGCLSPFVCLGQETRAKQAPLPKRHSDAVLAVAVSADGKWLATGSADHTIILWDLAKGTPVRVLAAHTGKVLSVSFSPDGRYLASGSEDKTLKLWEVRTGREARALVRDFPAGTKQLAFIGKGELLASLAGWQYTKWEVETGKELSTSSGPFTSGIAASPDGRWVAVVGGGTSIALWDVPSWALEKPLGRNLGSLYSVAYSQDGRWLVVSTSEGQTKLLDPGTGEVVRTLSGLTSPNFAIALALSPDGRLVAAGGLDDIAYIWQTESGELIAKVGPVVATSLAFTPDGLALLAGTADGVVQVWDPNTGTALRTIGE